MGVMAEILPFLRPSRGIERVANRAADSPWSEILCVCSQHKDARLVECHHGVEPDLEELLDIAKVADDLFGGPAVELRTPRQLGIRLTGDRPLQLAPDVCWRRLRRASIEVAL
jgi:hypothetical protein